MPRDLLTIGHSSLPIDTFLSLLTGHAVTAVADVRSTPYSRRHPQFNRETLARTLAEHGIAYVFLGAELGARSADPACYVDGQARYDRIAATPLFREGLARLERGMHSHRVALMCAEADPIACHRTILVCRTLRGTGIEIAHILADGRLETQVDAEARLVARTRADQAGLFESSDPVERAYDLQAERIAYRRPASG
jgi:uncharacterized protein (DUF488 family)